MTTKRKSATNESLSLADGALDTLGCVFQTMGRESFALDSDTNLHEFSEHCLEIARHVEHGSAAPAVDIDEAEVGTRQWGKVRRFFVDRRKQEKSYVVDRLGDEGRRREQRRGERGLAVLTAGANRPGLGVANVVRHRSSPHLRGR